MTCICALFLFCCRTYIIFLTLIFFVVKLVILLAHKLFSWSSERRSPLSSELSHSRKLSKNVQWNWALRPWVPTWRLHTKLCKFEQIISPNISPIWKMSLIWILARILGYLFPFICQNLDYICIGRFDFDFSWLLRQWKQTITNCSCFFHFFSEPWFFSWSVSCNDVWGGWRKRRAYFCPFASNWIERVKLIKTVTLL